MVRYMVAVAAAGAAISSWRVVRWWRRTSAEFDEILERRLAMLDDAGDVFSE